MKHLARIIFFTLLFTVTVSTSTVNAQQGAGGMPNHQPIGEPDPCNPNHDPDCNQFHDPPTPPNAGGQNPSPSEPEGSTSPPNMDRYEEPIHPGQGGSNAVGQNPSPSEPEGSTSPPNMGLPPGGPPDTGNGGQEVPVPVACEADCYGKFDLPPSPGVPPDTGNGGQEVPVSCEPDCPNNGQNGPPPPPCAPPNPNLPPPPGPPPPCSAPPSIDPVTGQPSELETVVDQDQIDRETELIIQCLDVGGNWLESTCTDVQENNTQALLACMDSGGIFLGGRNGLPWNHCETQYIADPDLPLVEDCYNSGGLWSESGCDTSTMTSDYAEVWDCVSGEYCDESFVEPECFALSELPGERATLCALSGIDPATGELLPHHPLYESENLNISPVDEIDQSDQEFLEPIPAETTLPPAPVYIPPVTIPPEPPRLPKPIMASPVLKAPIQEMQLFNNGIVNIPKEDFDKVDWDSLSKRRDYSPKQTKYSTPESETTNQNSAAPTPVKPNKEIVNIPKEDFDKVDWDSLSKRRDYSPKQTS